MTLLPRTRLCRRIASETAGVIFLRAPAGAGKSVLLEMLAKELGTQICRTHQPRSDDAANDCLLWDVPVFARAVRMPAAILETVRFVVIACRPDQRISGLARQILHRGSLIIGPDELALGQDEIESLPLNSGVWYCRIMQDGRPFYRSPGIRMKSCVPTIFGKTTCRIFHPPRRLSFHSGSKTPPQNPRRNGQNCCRPF